MTNKQKEAALVLFLVGLCAALLSAMIFVAIKINAKVPESGYTDSAYYCPAENKKSMAKFIDNCTGAHSEAYCYALAKAEYCERVERF